MLTRENILQLLRSEQPFLAAEFGVSKIGLFGSYAKGYAGDASDIDLLVTFERPIGFDSWTSSIIWKQSWAVKLKS